MKELNGNTTGKQWQRQVMKILSGGIIKDSIRYMIWLFQNGTRRPIIARCEGVIY